jgi:hypothetical protein
MNLNGRIDGAILLLDLVDRVHVHRMRVGACTIQGAMITVEARLDVIGLYVFCCFAFTEGEYSSGRYFSISTMPVKHYLNVCIDNPLLTLRIKY